ncbi:MAG TPA: bifunctional ornithine acetyltransferase/N-acetylglutamate synthase [Opitutaceae bacterium]|nr:bifunctional ornithine acetyltransferase/N-acetylglutamate synthase [Opitutaceae bacterium]
MTSTSGEYSSAEAHRAWLQTQAALPAGFRVATTRFDFVPAEAPKPATMTLTLIALDRPTPDFAAVFTRNAFPGAPVVIGRRRLAARALGAVLINNKISNVCAPGGVEASERLCAGAARLLGLDADAVLPSSTGVIGWALPTDAMIRALPDAVRGLSSGSVLPAAEGIVTTDLFPKVRRAAVGAGSIVGIAKGAGMIEPNLATMLVYLLTDVAVPRERLRALLAAAVAESFNCISVDSDTSTSDTVALLSSGRVALASEREFADGLNRVCRDLAQDVVRNGEGVRHVIRVTVRGLADRAAARALGKAVVNAPLFKCAVAGNDANVGRLVQAIGKSLAGGDAASRRVGSGVDAASISGLRLRMGGIEIFADGVFQLDRAKEEALTRHLKQAELYASAAPVGGVFTPPIHYPPHQRCVEIDVEFREPAAGEPVVVYGGDLTHEYVSENADYRS